ncbi:Ff.00g036370.m01.CDS01 [Fusarium sp. VM40]|nr:Ff.00g036370.m01.CDS01 [Fusarium sp. VM40]
MSLIKTPPVSGPEKGRDVDGQFVAETLVADCTFDPKRIVLCTDFTLERGSFDFGNVGASPGDIAVV